MSLNAKAACTVQYVLAVAAGKIAFGKATIVDRIQQVRLANAILSANTHYTAGKIKPGLLVIFEMGE
jgi:hypothetical protein